MDIGRGTCSTLFPCAISSILLFDLVSLKLLRLNIFFLTIWQVHVVRSSFERLGEQITFELCCWIVVKRGKIEGVYILHVHL